MLQLFQHLRFFIGALACFFVVSGCVQISSDTSRSNPVEYPATLITYLATELAPALQQAHSGQQLLLAQSPWGSDAVLSIDDRYFSAAGKACVNANVTVNSLTQAVVICQYEQQRWGATRALTSLLQQ